MSHRSYTVLFTCTGNWARPDFGEVMLNHCGEGRFSAMNWLLAHLIETCCERISA